MFKIKLVPDGDVMVFCEYCAQGTFYEEFSVPGIVSVKQWMYHHVVGAHRQYRYAKFAAYPMR